MDVLIKVIKGMELPCTLTIFPNRDIDKLIDGNYVTIGKAIELPPHGELKDYDSIGNKMSNTYGKNKDKWNPDFADGFMYALKMLDKAPTILGAGT